MNDKYYIPEIEELNLNYICEIFNPYIKDFNNQYEKIILDKNSDWEVVISDQIYVNNNIRTKYLDDQDIESLGFVNMGATKNNIIIFKLFNKDFNLIKENNKIKITKIDLNFMFEIVLFNGKCKSINELKTLLKMLCLQ